MSRVQIDADIWQAVEQYHELLDAPIRYQGDEAELARLHGIIVKGIQTRKDAQDRRFMYTMYKTSTGETAELARQIYLDQAGISPSARWTAEQDTHVTPEQEQTIKQNNDDVD